jgi:hypothetical protein
MTDYEQLVKALRCIELRLSCNECEYGKWSESGEAWSCDFERRDTDAADAIEALQAQLPKRGEIVRCGECKHNLNAVCSNPCGKYKIVTDDEFCDAGEREVQE